jgi:hypothetical protein
MMKYKEIGRKRVWLNLRYYPGIHRDGLRKTTNNFSQDSGLRAEVSIRDLPNTKEC